MTLYGLNNCGSCPAPCDACTGTKVEYGFAVPGDPVYGFGYPDPKNLDMVGLAARGNIIIGDYTSQDFQHDVVPSLKPAANANPKGKTQAYVVDSHDADLGYHTGKDGFMYDSQNRPLFNGNYDQQDKQGIELGWKLDANGNPLLDGLGEKIPRKFYEATMSDSAFQKLLDTNKNGIVDTGDNPFYDSTAGKSAKIDAVLFTNHALAGRVYANTLALNGAMVSRDDALNFGTNLVLNHDMRLSDSRAINDIALPFRITRPRLVTLQECPPGGCSN